MTSRVFISYRSSDGVDLVAPANASGSRLDAVTLHVTHSGEDAKLYSEPIDMTRDPVWTGFAQQWHERFERSFEMARGAAD
jgi:hypothetical protein